MLRGSQLSIGDLFSDTVSINLSRGRISAQSETGSLKTLFSMSDHIGESAGGRVGSVVEALLGALLNNVAVEPDAVELGVGHVAGAGDETSASWGVAEAVEGLGHAPLGGGVEELDMLAYGRYVEE